MILADLIKGNKTAITLPPANANPAKVAKVDPVSAVLKPRLAGLATLALAESEQTDTEPATFEQTGDPVTCPYWYQVCHAVEMYREQCTRNTTCRVYKFLEVNT